MIFISQDIRQDTIKIDSRVINDSPSLNQDSVAPVKTNSLKDSVKNIPLPAKKSLVLTFSDTTSVCCRNSIADITFFDSANLVTRVNPEVIGQFPYIFTENNRIREAESRAVLIKNLKSGKLLPEKTLNDDWVILIILISLIMFSIIKTASKRIFPEFSRFFLLRGINEPASRDIGGIFHWQSTIINLGSFLSISLFAYCIADVNKLIPSGIHEIILLLVFLVVLILAVTIRHITCVLTGMISGSKEVFQEYLVGVYQSYRFGSIIIFIIVILMSYTTIFPVSGYIFIGLAALSLMYLIRIIRLLKIFINRNISLLYLILYLCALEILPVVISVKYFTGLV